MNRRSARGKTVSKCDQLLRQIILLERENKCEWCGRSGVVLQASHIFSKAAHPRLRFHKKNILLFCVKCHLYRWHRSPLEAWEFIRQYKGEGYKDELMFAEAIAPKMSRFNLQLLHHELENELELLKG